VKVALIGGTGKLGRGLAVRLSVRNDVLIGSRDESRGSDAARKLNIATGRETKGGKNEEVAKECDVAVLAIPSLEEAQLLSQ
jgi:predicted dinucleotide-binding enzyme